MFDRFLPPTCSQKAPKMGGKHLGKFDFGPLGRPRVPPCTTKSHQSLQNGAQGPPKASKMELKGPPKPPNWSPKHPQSIKKGTQATPRAPKMESKMTPGDPK